MPYKKPVRVAELAHTGSSCKQADLRSTPCDEPATGVKPATDAGCPACGKGGCHQHASVRGHARYRCLSCYKIFSVPPVKTRVQTDEYERWLADMAS